MARARYVREDLGAEVKAPSGYYEPAEEAFLDYGGGRVLYTLGSACIEASCCGGGGWLYARVEGYLVESDAFTSQRSARGATVDTIEDVTEQAAIAGLLREKHPGVRVEFR